MKVCKPLRAFLAMLLAFSLVFSSVSWSFATEIPEGGSATVCNEPGCEDPDHVHPVVCEDPDCEDPEHDHPVVCEDPDCEDPTHDHPVVCEDPDCEDPTHNHAVVCEDPDCEDPAHNHAVVCEDPDCEDPEHNHSGILQTNQMIVPTLLGPADGLTIKYVEVANGGEHQITWRDGVNYDVSLYTVYKGDETEGNGRGLAVNGEDPDKYYTTARIVNMQDPRNFTFEIVVDNSEEDYTAIFDPGNDEGDPGPGANEFDPARVDFTYIVTDNNPETTPRASDYEPITAVTSTAEIDGNNIVITSEVAFKALPNATSSTAINRPYTPYYTVGRPSSSNRAWEYVGDYPIIAYYDADGDGQQDAEEEVLGQDTLRHNLNDSTQKWQEMNVWAEAYAAANPDGGTDYGPYGRYMKVESFGKSAAGRDMWGVVISDSKESVDEYLSVTVPLMNKDPEAMQQEIRDGTFDHKGVIMWGAIHGNEVEGNSILPDTRDRLMQKESIRFSVKNDEGVRRILPTSNTNSGRTTFAEGTARNENNTDVELDIDKLLENYIIVINLWTNPDGNSIPQRGNIYGEDPNRDGGLFAFKETQATIKWMTKWEPIYYVEHHDQVGTWQIDGCTPPTEASLEADLIDKYMVPLLDAMGRAGIGNTGLDSYAIPTRDMVSDWDAGSNIYAASMAMMTGALGSTLEYPNNTQDSVDAGLQGQIGVMKYMLEERDGLYDNKLEHKVRAVNNIDAKDLVDPLLVSVHWLLEDVRDAVTFPMNEPVAQPRPRAKDAEGNELSFFPEYYIIPVDKKFQHSPSGAVENLKLLQELGGVEIDRTTTPVTVDGTTYPTGTYVVSMHQGRRSFAQSVLYPGFDSAIFAGAIYDNQTQISWPAMRGFNILKTWERDVFKGKTERVDLDKQVELPGSGTYVAYTNGGHDAIRLTNRLLNSGKDVWMVTGYVPGAALGDFVAKRTDVLANVGVQDNAALGPVALSVFGVDAGNAVPANTKKLVKPVIATARPSGNSLRFAYDAMEFDDSNFSTTLGTGSVYVGTSAPSEAQAAYGAVLYNASGSIVNNANVLDTDAVTPSIATGSLVELVGKADWFGNSIVASNYDVFDQLFSYTNNRYGTKDNARSDIKVLASYTTEEDLYMGGRKGAAQANTEGNRGAIAVISGVRANGTGVTAMIDNFTTRSRHQAMWNLFATSIFAYAAGIADVPRPTVSADITELSDWTNALDVQLDILAEDTVGVNATVAEKKYKISAKPMEDAYDAADAGWRNIPADDKVVFDASGECYLHWYVENSEGVSSQGSFGPYLVDVEGPSFTAAASGTSESAIMLDVTDIVSVSGIASYLWERKDGDIWIPISSLKSYRDVGLLPNTTYTYRVTLTDNAGNEVTVEDLMCSTTQSTSRPSSKNDDRDENPVGYAGEEPAGTAPVETPAETPDVTSYRPSPADTDPAGTQPEKPFINGYPDGTFKPNGELTRAEAAAVFYTLFADGAGGNGTFPDVPADHWAAAAIAYCKDKGIISGYPDGSFNPSGQITRAEFFAMLIFWLGLEPADGNFFTDLEGNWAAGIINALAKVGYLTGYPDGTVKPNEPITRAEMLVMMSKLAQRSTGHTGSNPFSDLSPDHWAYDIILNAATGNRR